MTLRLNGSTSGYTEIDAPAVAGSNTLLLPTGAGSAYQVVRNGATAGSLEFADKIVSGTAVASTSGTSIDFTGIPSWVKRITVVLDNVSTNGASNPLVQLGSGSITTTGYVSSAALIYGANLTTTTSWTTGIGIFSNQATDGMYGAVYLNLVTGNTWLGVGSVGIAGRTGFSNSTGKIALSGTLDRVRITTVNGTDTFDAGSINILYE
jgi:hypothetical protein